MGRFYDSNNSDLDRYVSYIYVPIKQLPTDISDISKGEIVKLLELLVVHNANGHWSLIWGQ